MSDSKMNNCDLCAKGVAEKWDDLKEFQKFHSDHDHDEAYNRKFFDISICDVCNSSEVDESGNAEAFHAWHHYEGHDNAPYSQFEDTFAGEHSSGAEFLKEFYESNSDSYGALDDFVKRFIDWGAMWKSCEHEYYVVGDYYFRNGY